MGGKGGVVEGGWLEQLFFFFFFFSLKSKYFHPEDHQSTLYAMVMLCVLYFTLVFTVFNRKPHVPL